MNGVCSELRETTMGVPQGSILGPLFFIFFVNDISNDLGTIKSYADDTNAICKESVFPALFDNSSQLMKNLNNWFAVNGLVLNEEKSNFILFHTKNTLSHNTLSHVVINNKNI